MDIIYSRILVATPMHGLLILQKKEPVWKEVHLLSNGVYLKLKQLDNIRKFQKVHIWVEVLTFILWGKY